MRGCGICFYGVKCVTGWVIYQYGFHLITRCNAIQSSVKRMSKLFVQEKAAISERALIRPVHVNQAPTTESIPQWIHPTVLHFTIMGSNLQWGFAITEQGRCNTVPPPSGRDFPNNSKPQKHCKWSPQPGPLLLIFVAVHFGCFISFIQRMFPLLFWLSQCLF